MSDEPRSPDAPETPTGSEQQPTPPDASPGQAQDGASAAASAQPAPEPASPPEPDSPSNEAAAPAETAEETPTDAPAAAAGDSPAASATDTVAEAAASVAEGVTGAAAGVVSEAVDAAKAVAETAADAAVEAGAAATAAAETLVEAATGGESAGEAAPQGGTEEASTESTAITTPEEAEAFVRSVRAEVPDTLPEVLEVGQAVRAVVKEIEGDDAVIDVSQGRFEIRLPKLDFVDASGKVSIAQGDSIALVIEELGEPPTFKRRTSAIGEAIGKIAEAFAARKPLEGKITASIKGGFEAKVEGVRAFLPGSQATLRRSDDKSKLLGQTLPLLVTKFDPSGRSIVVSRRKILEKERKQQAKETRARLAKGATFTGRVVALQAYGAFVDIGGLQGLLHLTEISWSRLRKPDEALKVGQRVDVQVLEHDESGKKISLSMRALLEDPWKSIAEDVKPNQVRNGKVLRIVKSGAIVELAPGVEARLALSELSPEGPLPAERKKELTDTEIAVQVVDFDAKRHRASLLLAPEGAEVGSIVEPPEVKAGAKLKGIVERVAPFGLFLRLAPGKLGLLHATESGTPPGTDLAKEFPPGMPLQVEVIEVNEEEGRIRLTRRTAFERMKDRERQKARQGRGGPHRDGPGGGRRGDRRGGRSSGPLVNPASAPKGGGFASFGDVLKSALGGGESAPEPEAPEAETATDPATEPDTVTDTVTDAVTDAVTDTVTDTVTATETDTDSVTEPETATETVAETETEPETDTETAPTSNETPPSEPSPEPATESAPPPSTDAPPTEPPSQT